MNKPTSTCRAELPQDSSSFLFFWYLQLFLFLYVVQSILLFRAARKVTKELGKIFICRLPAENFLKANCPTAFVLRLISREHSNLTLIG